MMNLYSGTTCPFSQRCRIVLYEKGMDFQVIDVDLFAKPEDIAIINPYGKVPVLVERDLILMKPSDIWKIGDSGIEMSMSDTATIEQNDAPQGASDTPTAASATLMSLWQTESVGFKVVRRINYAKRRSGAVSYIGDAAYGQGT